MSQGLNELDSENTKFRDLLGVKSVAVRTYE